MNGRQRVVVVVAVGLALAVIVLAVEMRRRASGAWFAYAPTTSQTDTYYVLGSDSELLRGAAVWLTAIALWAGFSVWFLRDRR